jgi:hypothetical protein
VVLFAEPVSHPDYLDFAQLWCDAVDQFTGSVGVFGVLERAQQHANVCDMWLDHDASDFTIRGALLVSINHWFVIRYVRDCDEWVVVSNV